jgi:hypothetical protein
MLGSRTARSAAASWTAIATGSVATGGGSSRGVGVGLAVAVGATVGNRVGVGVGVGWSGRDAPGTPLVAVHAARSNVAHIDTAIHRDKDRELPTPAII